MNSTPARVCTLCVLAAAHSASGNHDLAEGLLKKAIAKDPAEPRPYAQLGERYFAIGRIEEAEAMYLRAIEIVEEDPHYHLLDPMVGWGDRLVGLGRVDEAVAMYERSIAANPTSSAALASWGKLLKMQGSLRPCGRLASQRA